MLSFILQLLTQKLMEIFKQFANKIYIGLRDRNGPVPEG